MNASTSGALREGAGFERPGEASQMVFRALLDAFAQPGHIREVPARAGWPAGIAPAAAAVMLAMLDADTRLWLHAGVSGNGEIAQFLRFHTGCRIVTRPAEADFGYVDHPGALPDLEEFAQGSERHPERSSTLVVRVAALEGHEWRLTGPGIEREVALAAAIPGARFLAQWQAQQRRFPVGVDLVLARGKSLAALPRTTRIEPA